MWRIAVIACAVLFAACATPPGPASGPKSPNQVKQQELSQMERVGQRNDFDKPLQ
jgi:hypothetical protein